MAQEEMRAGADDLRIAADRYRLMVEEIADHAFFMLDPRGHVVTWNKGAERLKGYTAPEIIGRHFSVFYPPEGADPDQLEERLARAAAGERVEDEGWRLRRDGTRFWANCVLTALREPGGGLIGFSKVTRDLTERRRADEAIRTLNVELSLQLAAREALLLEARTASQHKSEFLAKMSHELRTPLSAILGFSDLLRESTEQILGDEQRQDLAEIHRSARVLLQLINDLLDISAIEAGKLPVEARSVDLRQVVTDVKRRLAPLAREKGLALDIFVPDLPAVVTADPFRTAQVLTNLVSNSIKFTDTGHIDVILSEDGDAYAVSVRDTGQGVRADVLDRVFEEFEQGDGPARFRPRGTGLGLAISLRLTELMGGTMGARSEEGQGSTFWFRLPR